MDFRIVGSGLEAGGGFPLSGRVGWPADQAAERPTPYDLLVSGPYHRYLIDLGHIRWVSWHPGAEGLPPLPPLRFGLDPLYYLCSKPGSLKAWKPQESMPGGLEACLACLGWRAGSLGWLGLLD